MKNSFVLSMVAGICAVSALSVPTLAQAGEYGAIAYSEGTGAYGWATDYDTRDIAESVALRRCGEHAQDCYVAIWVHNGCAALARGSRVGNVVHAGWAWATGQGSESANRGVAERQALTFCSQRTTNCTVTATVCSGRQ
ncbi:MAG: DUF4189 domain-containing protein [Polyangiaceae bacterium]|nr:DUF4189 domain-containing protein [Polyangiaceae bacterium]